MTEFRIQRVDVNTTIGLCSTTVLCLYCSVFVLCNLILLTKLKFENISQYLEKYVFTLSFFVFPQHGPQFQSPLCSIVLQSRPFFPWSWRNFVRIITPLPRNQYRKPPTPPLELAVLPPQALQELVELFLVVVESILLDSESKSPTWQTHTASLICLPTRLRTPPRRRSP